MIDEDMNHIVLFINVRRIRENEPFTSNILLCSPFHVPQSSLSMIYEALMLNTFLFTQSLSKPVIALRFGGSLRFSCRLTANRRYLFAVGATKSFIPDDKDLEARAKLLFNLLVLEFGCLACAASSHASFINERLEHCIDLLNVEPELVRISQSSAVVPSLVLQKSHNLLSRCRRAKMDVVVGGGIWYGHWRVFNNPEMSLELMQALSFQRRLPPSILVPSFTGGFGIETTRPFMEFHSQLKSLNLPDGIQIEACCLPVETHIGSTSVRLQESTICCAFKSCIQQFFILTERHSDCSVQLLLQPDIDQALINHIHGIIFVMLRDIALSLLRSWSISETQSVLFEASPSSASNLPLNVNSLSAHRSSISSTYKGLLRDTDIVEVEFADPPDPLRQNHRTLCQWAVSCIKCLSPCLTPWKQKAVDRQVSGSNRYQADSGQNTSMNTSSYRVYATNYGNVNSFEPSSDTDSSPQTLDPFAYLLQSEIE